MEYYWFYFKNDEDKINEIGIIEKHYIDGDFLCGDGVSYFPTHGTMERSEDVEEQPWHARIDNILCEATYEDYNYMGYLFGRYMDLEEVTDAIKGWIKDHSGVEYGISLV